MSISHDKIDKMFVKMKEKFVPEKASGLEVIIQFHLVGEEDVFYWVNVKNQTVELNKGEAEQPHMTLTANAEDYASVLMGETSAMQAFMAGKLKVKGDMGLAMKLQSIFGL